jgi:hypothetical protein
MILSLDREKHHWSGIDTVALKTAAQHSCVPGEKPMIAIE